MRWWAAHESDYELLPTGGPSSRLPQSRTGRSTASQRSLYVLAAAGCLLGASLTLFLIDTFTLRWRHEAYESVFQHLWPVGMANRTDNWENENSKSMHALFTCLTEENCEERQKSIVILSSHHFSNSVAGAVSGEDIWATSISLALREMGFTIIYAPQNHELARTYRQYPHLVKAIFLEGSDARRCFDDPKCIKTPTHPLGVPAWKMFSFHFWTGASHPLGNAWTVSPENYPLLSPWDSKDNFYLGYSIERTCMEMPYMPSHERPLQAYILSKRLSYFFDKDVAWKNMSFVPPFPLSLVAGLQNDTIGPSSVPEGIRDIGRLDKRRFYEELSKSRALIGIGLPYMSPSPYDALCMGVPFINPILDWDPDDPDDRNKWRTQHNGLKFLGPPHVYNIRNGDREGFWDALEHAIHNPIPRYIPPEMTMDSLKRRLVLLLEGDWKTKAEKLLAERLATGNGKVFEI